MVHLPGALELLGRHVSRRPHGLMRARELQAPRVAAELRQPEVHELDPAEAVEEHILGLDVPVHHALVVGVLERFAQGGDDGQGLRLGQPSIGQHLAQVGPVHELHDDPGEVLDLAEVVHRDDTGVHQPREGLGLALEALGPPLDLAGGWQQDLDRDLPVELHLPRPKDGAHAAPAEALHELVVDELRLDADAQVLEVGGGDPLRGVGQEAGTGRGRLGFRLIFGHGGFLGSQPAPRRGEPPVTWDLEILPRGPPRGAPAPRQPRRLTRRCRSPPGSGAPDSAAGAASARPAGPRA